MTKTALSLYVFFLIAAPLFAQSGEPSSLASEIQNIENTLNRPGVSGAERRQALTRLAQIRQLSGDLENAAKNWLEAAAANPMVDDSALLSCAYCLAAMGEWDRATAAIRPLLNSNTSPVSQRAHFLDASIKAWRGDLSALGALAGSPLYIQLRSEIYYTLWKTALDSTSAEAWKQRLLAEFPQSPEALIAASASAAAPVVSAKPNPLWLLFPGWDGAVAQTAAVASGPAVPARPEAVPAAPVQSPAPAQPGTARLQTGVFSQQANANAQMDQLTRAGFSPVMERRIVDGGERWAVIVPAADANQGIAQLRTAGFESFPLR
ncbi:MAG: SPOR domain-containing protein [Treponema sp.]|nr:SPOR domain-containing protein [Treponema sp.]